MPDPCNFCGATCGHHSAECIDTQGMGYRVVDEAYSFISNLVDSADWHIGTSPLWHGWALREAFIAGAKYQLGQIGATSKDAEEGA